MAPISAYWYMLGTPTTFRPFLSMEISATPMTVLPIDPFPSSKDVPPMMLAPIASNSQPMAAAE